MAEKLSVMVIDADKSVRKILRDQLNQMDSVRLVSEWKQMEPASGVLQGIKPDLLILELPEESERALKWIERTKLELPHTAIFVSSAVKTPELVISAMRAGAQEFLGRPIDLKELRNAVEKVLRTKGQATAQAPARGRIISVFSKKGGLGVTTLAVNLAVALSQAGEKKAALIDLDLQLGDVASFLNLSPNYNILDSCTEDGGVDAIKLQSCLSRHESGVYVLPEPRNPADSDNVSSSQINQILRHLRSMFSYVIVDTPHMLDARTLDAFELSDNIIVVVVPNVSSIRAAKRALGVLQELGYARDKVRVVANRVSKRDPIKVDQVEKALHYPVSWVVPNNYPVVIDAINSGVPLVNHKGSSNVSKSIMELANDIPEWSRDFYVELKE
jgi:pilus assembly protein CpaE